MTVTALKAIKEKQQQEIEQGIALERLSFVLTHKKPAKHCVLMLHGYTASPYQYRELAQLFYKRGYNVYVPLLPKHGTDNHEDAGELLKNELTIEGQQALEIAQKLGDTVGIVGISAGANLGTWLTLQNQKTVERLLLIAPFYRPSKQMVPAPVLKIASVVYGYRLLPNRYAEKFSFYTIAQLVSLAKSYHKNKKHLNLQKIGMVIGSHDRNVDHDLALAVGHNLAKHSGIELQTYISPEEWQAGHDIVTPGHPAGKGKTQEFYDVYLQFYA